MLGIGKGGFPLGSFALPILILIWPDQAGAARQVVAFMLPLLCAMDLVSVAFYRKYILWRMLAPLVPGILVGVTVASFLFVSDSTFLLSVSDRLLKLLIGLLSAVFVVFQVATRFIPKKSDVSSAAANPGPIRSWISGVAAGIVSTISHSAGPIVIMYFVPQRPGKLGLAGTIAGFAWGLNLVKLIPFGLLGRLETGNLLLAAWTAPVIPLGVGAGFLLVKILKERHYFGLVYGGLMVTAVLLIRKAIIG